MRTTFLALALAAAAAALAQGPSAQADLARAAPTPRTRFTAEESADIKRRLLAMDYIIDHRDHPVVEAYLRGYLLRNRAKSETILGRIPTYFPMFEEELRRAGLPDDLKYLAVVESALHPRALSPVGAGGLWQFMPGTGQLFGLRVDRTVDERGDALLATRAAVAFLKAEYARFGDWALVLAAYNGGPGRVRRAMRRSGRRDFWQMRRYLPRETRNYVPAFIAAAYLHRYGALHGLRPEAVSLDEQLMVSVACPRGVSLREVAQASDLPLAMLQYYNPHCLRGYLPAGTRAHCRVPKRTAPRLRAYLQARATDPDGGLVAEVRARPVDEDGFATSDEHYTAYDVEVAAGTPLRDVARDEGVSTHHLRLWNPGLRNAGPGDRLTEARTLRLYTFPGDVAPRAALRNQAALPRLALRPPRPIVAEARPGRIGHRGPNHRVTLRRYETLLDVWHRYSATMTWQEFVSWNGIGSGADPQPGDQVLIRS